MLTVKVKKQMMEAMKAKDEIRLSTLKLLSAALHNAKIAKLDDLNHEEEIEVVQKESKKRKDSIEAYEKAGAQERADKEKEELKILQEYLPKEMGDKELTKIVKEVISASGAENIKDFGNVMGKVMGKVKGQADGKRVAEIVKKSLAK